MKIRNAVFAKVALVTLLGLSGQGQVQAQWNAYNDFYLSPNAGNWSANGGATSASALGAAWGYLVGNVNFHGGFPPKTGVYLNSGQTYNFAGVAWDSVSGGRGFGRYATTFEGSTVSLGTYGNPQQWSGWNGAPGYGQGLNNLVWMQAGWLGGNTSQGEGLASVLTWTAPSSGVYQFAGLFVGANQPGNKASVAIVDSLGGANPLLARLERYELGVDETKNFSFSASYNTGDVVQFQVGSNFASGNAVGLQVTATAIPEPSSGLLFMAGLGALGLVRRLRRQA